MTVPVSYEILCCRASVRPSGVDVAYQHPLAVGHLQHVWALPHAFMASVAFAEAALEVPVLKVLRAVEIYFLSCGNHQVPLFCAVVPEHIGVAEVGHVGCNNRVVLIFLKGLAIVGAVSQALRLTGISRCVHSHHGILSESGSVALINHRRAAEHKAQSVGVYGLWLVLPVYEVGAGGVSPRYVTPYRAVKVVLIIEVPYAVFVEHAVGVVHPSPHRCVVIDGPPLFAVGRVEGVAQLYELPAAIVFYVTHGAIASVEGHLYQHAALTVACQIDRNKVVGLACCHPDIESFEAYAIFDDAYFRVALFLLNGYEEIVLVSLKPHHSVRRRQNAYRQVAVCLRPCHAYLQ